MGRRGAGQPLAGCFPATGTRGRVIVGPSLQVEHHPEVFVVGDAAEIHGRQGPPPMLVQVAIQSGRHAMASVLALSAGRPATGFSYRDLGTMAALGRGNAAAQIHRLHLSGLLGWLAWLSLHILRTNGLQAKTTVLLNWVPGFLFADRPVRLITWPTPPGAPEPHTRQPAAERDAAPVPVAPARAGPPSVNVANAGRLGRVAALAWWSQDYPGLRPEPKPETVSVRRRRAERLRHMLTGGRSTATDRYQG